MTEEIERGRKAFADQAWADAFDHLSAAAESSPLGLDDLERRAAAAYLVGRADESLDFGREPTTTVPKAPTFHEQRAVSSGLLSSF
jgi:hypothetical protein